MSRSEDEIEEQNKILEDFIQAQNVARKGRMPNLIRKESSYNPLLTPVPAGNNQPMITETSPQQQDREAAILKQDGPRYPMPNIRPQPPQASHEDGSVIVARELAGQLGTSPEIKAQQRIDERKYAVLTDTTLIALSHFSYRHIYDGVRYWGHITEWFLTGSQGIGGLARRHTLQAIANASGIQVMDKAEKPNAIARNIWDRGWREKAAKEGKMVDE